MFKKTIVDLDSFKVSLKMVDKVITDFHSFKASGAYFTSVVVRKNWEPGFKSLGVTTCG